MNEVTFIRPARAEPPRVLQCVEKWLCANGYEVSARSNFELSLVGLGPGGRHRLSVRADGNDAHFTFAPGSPGVALPPSSELERRVEFALVDVSGPAPVSAAAATRRRCSICATMLGEGVNVCPTCGMAQ